MADIIQIRRDLAANWTSVNPILAQGELGLELDTGRVKVGNATDAWNDLPYAFNTGVAISAGAQSIGNGTLLFSNANGITFGLNGSTLTASISTTPQFVFSNSNNVSFGTAGSTVTATASFSQSVQPAVGVIASNTTYTSGNVSFRDGNGVSFATTTGQGVSLTHALQYTSNTSAITSNALNTSQSSLFRHTSADSQLQFTSAMSNFLGTTYTTHTHAQSNQTLGLYMSSNTLYTSSGTQDARSLTFRGEGAASVGYSAGEVVVNVPPSSGGSSGGVDSATYDADTASQAASDPGAGKVRWNDSTQTDSTEIYIDDLTKESIDVSAYLGKVTVGTILRIQAESDATQYQRWEITSITDNTGWWTLGVALIDSDGVDFSNNDDLVLSIYSAFGRLNVSAGTTSNNVSNLVFSNSNGIGFGLNGVTITASHNAITSQSVDTGKAGTGFTSAGANIGLSGTLNTNGLSLSATAAAQTNQTLGVYASSQTIGSASSATYDARSISVIGAGIVSVGNHSTNGGTTTGFIISATQSDQAISGSNGSFAFQTATFGSSNGLHFYTTNGSLVGSYTVPTVTNSSFSVQDSATTLNPVARIAFSTGNNITLTLSTGASSATVGVVHNLAGTSSGFGGNLISGSMTHNSSGLNLSLDHPAWLTTAAQSTQTFLASLSGNTATTNSSQIGNGAFAFAGGNGVTLQQSNNTVSWSVATSYRASNDAIGLNTAQSNVTWTVNSSGLSLDARGYAGTGTTINLTNLTGAITQNSNGIRLDLEAAAPGAAAESNWHHLLGANTAGNTTASGSTIGLSGINVTLSGTNNSVINIIGHASSSLSGTGQVSLVTNGGTVSIGVPAAYTQSGHHPYRNLDMIFTNNQGSLMLHPIELPHFQYDRVIFPMQISNATNSSGSHTVSFWYGLYSKNDSTLSLVASTSSSTAVTHSGTVGSYSLYSGVRLFTIPMTSTVTKGHYWIGFVSRTTSGGANGSYSLAYASQGGSNFVGHFGSSHNTTYQFSLGIGVYNTTTSGIPNSIGFSQIRGSDLLLLRPALIQFASGTV